MRQLIHLLRQTAPYSAIALLGLVISLQSHFANRFIGWTDKTLFPVNPLLEIVPWLGLGITLAMIALMIVVYEAPRD